ncbi:aKG-HExxH-type peptide beta-hydroxylase [Actinomadura napierensis]|uniref:HEXXH motif domain-containing protein n=1 Tax=Actinomadura napierensis TaxID=267854 RepID=A0ABN2ZS58_9ACTN
MGALASEHRLLIDHFRELAHGLGGPDAVGCLAQAEYSKHMLLIRAIVEHAGAESVAHHAYQRLASLYQRSPQAVAALISRPEVGAWAVDCLRALRDGRPDAACDRLAHWADLPDQAQPRCRISAGGLQLDVAISGVDPSLHRYRYEVDQPDLDRWHERLAGAWRILVTRHRPLAEELTVGLRTVVPLRRVPGTVVVSATSPAAFGAVATSLPTDDVTTAETLIHEFQHVKLGAVLDMLLLVRPEAAARAHYYAPWRDDPRPLVGLLQGAYAYLGVARFWRRERFAVPSLNGHIEFARRRVEAHQTTGTLLASEGLTDDGVEFVSLMRGQLAAWLSEPVPERALRRAAMLSAAHRSRWRPS